MIPYVLDTLPLAHGTVDTLAHWSFLFMLLVLCITASGLMLFLESCGAYLECGQVDRIGLHQSLGHRDDIADQLIEKIQRHGFSNHDSQDLSLLFLWWEWIVYEFAVSPERAFESRPDLLGMIYCFTRSRVLTASCLI